MRFDIDVNGVDRLVATCDQAAGPEALDAAQLPAGQMFDRAVKAAAVTRQMARSVRSNRLTVGNQGIELEIGGSGGDAQWAVGAQFGATFYRQFPPAVPDGYTVGSALDSTLDDITDLFAEAALSPF